MKKVKRAIIMLLAIAMAVSASSLPLVAFAAEQEYEMAYSEMDNQERAEADMVARGINIRHITDNSLITNVTSPSNGKISFYINIPARQTLYYTLKLVPNKRTGSIDTVVDKSYKNLSNSKISQKITVSTKYFSNNYTLTASFTTGNDRERTMYETEKTVTSKLVSAVTSNKFVWDKAHVNQWAAQQVIYNTYIIGIEKMASVAAEYIPKLKLGAVALTALISAGLTWNSTQPATSVDIMFTPVEGWAYQIKFAPASNGYNKTLVIYNKNGGVASTESLGFMPLSTISVAVY